MGQYYVVLRSVVRKRPRLRRYLCRCRQCRIFFLTHPRNAGRRDLSCPFGCRQEHRRQKSTQRSTKYNRTPDGKDKKRAHNQRRRGRKPLPGPKRGGSRTRQEKPAFDPGIVHYLQIVISLIEGRGASAAEIMCMLERAVRQHRMAFRRRRDYVLSSWKGSVESP